MSQSRRCKCKSRCSDRCRVVLYLTGTAVANQTLVPTVPNVNVLNLATGQVFITINGVTNQVPTPQQFLFFDSVNSTTYNVNTGRVIPVPTSVLVPACDPCAGRR